MKSSKQIVNDFLTQVTTELSPKETLILNFTNPNILELENEFSYEIRNENEFSQYEQKQFELIIGDLPFGLQTVPVDTKSKLRVNKNWSFILSALRKLKTNGKAFFLVEPSILFSQQGKRYLQDLSLENYFINSVFELPEKLLYPVTAFQPIIIVFEKLKSDKLFIGELTTNYELLLENFLQKTNSEDLSSGIEIERENFESFNKFRIENEINNLKTQYKEYTKYQLFEVADEINTTREQFENKKNSIYIPKIGNSRIISSIEKTTLKHQNYFQIVLTESIVIADFLALFYKSELGQLILKSLTNGSYIPKINKADIEASLVTIPKLAEQNLLVITNQKLSELQETIIQLQTELSLNPKNAEVILDKFESIKNPLKKLSDEDQIFSLIRKGENKYIEFKETFSKNIRTGDKDKEIEKSSLKNIVGFLNADGGTLLIGISDDGQVAGVENDFFKSPDKYKLNFKNALDSKIGSEFYSLIDYDLYSVGGKMVLKVECKPSDEPCFYNQTDFFVRTNPATDKLEGRKQLDYIKTRFK